VSYDVIVAGGGHNGLVCAAYLARAGLRVVVLERRERLGGLVEVLPNAARLRPSVIADLHLHRHGLELVRPRAQLLALGAPGDAPLAFSGEPAGTAQDLQSQVAEDGDAYQRFDAHVRRLAGFLAELHTQTPPRLDRLAPSDAPAGLALARAYRALGPRAGRELTRALPMAAADFVAEWFASDRLRAALVTRGCLFTAMGPWSAGTALVMLSDSAGTGRGAVGDLAYQRGGPARLAQALADAARAAGAELRTEAAVEHVLVEGDRVAGVALASGEEIAARAVACAVDPKTVLTGWLPPEVAGPQLRWRAGNIRTPGATAVVELALAHVPAFAGIEDERLQGRIVLAPGVDEVERAFDAWKYGEIAERPLIDATIPSLADPSQARDGTHLLRALVQWVPHGSDGAGLAQGVVDALEPHAPGLSALVSATRVQTPADLERDYGLHGGHLYHCEPSLDQFFAWRPIVGLARYRLGLSGLYLCGAGAHPGGGITGGPGQNSAREIVRDLGRRSLRSPVA
jgi:phytoene dehydrogenase-like protein